jgi:hypothetical protein
MTLPLPQKEQVMPMYALPSATASRLALMSSTLTAPGRTSLPPLSLPDTDSGAPIPFGLMVSLGVMAVSRL